MLIAAIIPLFTLPVPLLPDMIRGAVFLLITVVWGLYCLFVLLWGGMVIFDLPCQKFFRRVIFIAWLPFYTLLCWAWATLMILVMMQIFGHV